MSTRSVFTFKGVGREQFHVYMHCDGYPSGAENALIKALDYAWELPRYEADDFAAAFIAGNKDAFGGGIRMSTGPRHHDDLAYRYSVSFDGTQLQVCCYLIAGEKNERLFSGSLAAFGKWARSSLKVLS